MRLALFLATFLLISANDLETHRVFNAKGKVSGFSEIVAAASEADIVLFGELHNSAIAHWLQIELTKALFEQSKGKLVLGAEMFESDDQLLLDEMVAGSITDKHFEKESKIWPNYRTDYKPLVAFAKENDLKFVATNIPRRYASKVAREGIKSLKGLSKEAKSLIAPLPIEVDGELPGYKALLEMDMGPHANGENFMNAQAIKDATMAHFILENFKKGSHFLHYNGAYHSNNFEGISWYLKKQNPKLKILTISCVETSDVSKLNEEAIDLADFIINIDEDVTKTH